MSEQEKENDERLGDNLIWEGEDLDDDVDAAWAEAVMEELREKLAGLLGR